MKKCKYCGSEDIETCPGNKNKNKKEYLCFDCDKISKVRNEIQNR